MKKIIVLSLMLALTVLIIGNADATVFTFVPSDADVRDLDHSYYYSWLINMGIPTGETITGATLTFKNIWDWKVEPDILSVFLVDSPPGGQPIGNNLWQKWDGQSTNPLTISGASALVGTWTDPEGGHSNNFNLVFDLGALNLLDELTAYISNNNIFGFVFDPDCHYYNDGIELKITTTANSVPEPATMLLFGTGLVGLGFFARRKKM